ncbi:Peroxisomal membrane protein 2 [Vitis vinifera]|uniref:Peroxisomal membrane protein 2 n=1 Tax=Vitis vinifera TaxID=29760 RepID=A0A438EFC2_VITVI|nr:Peroxisomal membrane protein 2 [Vitis vinifera]
MEGWIVEEGLIGVSLIWTVSYRSDKIEPFLVTWETNENEIIRSSWEAHRHKTHSFTKAQPQFFLGIVVYKLICLFPVLHQFSGTGTGTWVSSPAMATLNTITAHRLFPLPKSITESNNSYTVRISTSSSQLFLNKSNPSLNSTFSKKKRLNWVINAVAEDQDLAPAQTSGSKVHQDEDLPRSSLDGSEDSEAGGTLAITRLLTIDHDYWHGWTLYEVLRYAPEHNWVAYEEALKTNPVLAKMAISGAVYSIGDWIAQCYEGKPLFEFDLTQLHVCSDQALLDFLSTGPFLIIITSSALFPSKDWWVVPAKVVVDQTVWAAIWNSIYYVALGFLRRESPANIYGEVKSTFWPMLTAGWKLWPFAHLITYGVIPVEQRLLWVDCVELIWVTILSTYSNEKSEARITEATQEANSRSSNNAEVSPVSEFRKQHHQALSIEHHAS